MEKEKKKRRKRCETCQALYERADLEYTEDPYSSEINGDDSKHWLCESCLYESPMEI